MSALGGVRSLAAALRATAVLVGLLAGTGAASAAIDVEALWDPDPAVAEARFRGALASASGDDALILETQIARTYGLRRDFEQARRILESIVPRLAQAGPEVRVRHALELGRTLASATHPVETQTDAVRAAARASYERAAELAREAGLDALRVDALHMMAFVDTSPAQQLRWARVALEVAEASSQPAAQRWKASLHHNAGYALHELGRDEDALREFTTALALREQGTDGEAIRVERWMIAWTVRWLGRPDEALALQLRLEREGEAAGMPDPDVLEELEILYRARGDSARADAYAARRRALSPPR